MIAANTLIRRTFLLLVSLILPFSSPAARADELTELGNRLAIAEMLTQYSYRWDGKASKSFSELFTEDGSMERWTNESLVPGSEVMGRAAIYEYAMQAHRGRLADRQSRHHFSGLFFLQLTEDLAITENMALITHQTADDLVPIIRSSGIYRNTWVKTIVGWRIKKRILIIDRGPSN
jgi:hypothetical protein